MPYAAAALNAVPSKAHPELKRQNVPTTINPLIFLNIKPPFFSHNAFNYRYEWIKFLKPDEKQASKLIARKTKNRKD